MASIAIMLLPFLALPVAGCMAGNYLLADTKTAMVLECDGLHYGSSGEEPAPNGGSFAACTDDFSSTEGHDAGGEATGPAMSAYGPSGVDDLSSSMRRVSLQWLLGGLSTGVDMPWLMANAAGMDHIYDEQGQKSYQVENARTGWSPASSRGSPSTVA